MAGVGYMNDDGMIEWRCMCVCVSCVVCVCVCVVYLLCVCVPRHACSAHVQHQTYMALASLHLATLNVYYYTLRRNFCVKS